MSAERYIGGAQDRVRELGNVVTWDQWDKAYEWVLRHWDFYEDFAGYAALQIPLSEYADDDLGVIERLKFHVTLYRTILDNLATAEPRVAHACGREHALVLGNPRFRERSERYYWLSREALNAWRRIQSRKENSRETRGGFWGSLISGMDIIIGGRPYERPRNPRS